MMARRVRARGGESETRIRSVILSIPCPVARRGLNGVLLLINVLLVTVLHMLAHTIPCVQVWVAIPIAVYFNGIS